MSSRRSSAAAVLVVGSLVTAGLTSCTAADQRERQPGAPVTADEARTLSEVLQRNRELGGAEFVATAPYGRQSVLTLTGEVDYRRAVGRAELTASTGDAGPDATGTVWFTAEELWLGDLPGLAEALAADGADGADVLRRPTAVAPGGTADLVDVLVGAVLNLSSPRTDEPGAYTAGDWTWQGQRSIDGRLSTLYGGPDGDVVAVGAGEPRLLQFTAPLTTGDITVTVTLADHGRRTIELPAEETTAAAADHPGIAESVGL